MIIQPRSFKRKKNGNREMFKKISITLAALFGFLVATGLAVSYWFSFTLPEPKDLLTLKNTLPEQLSYTQNTVLKTRGKILAIVSSTRELGATGQPTGFDLMELARAYWVFSANGFSVDVASPKGGEVRAVLDDEDMGAYDYAFLNSEETSQKIKNTLALKTINAEEYAGFYFVGGKGAMFDFPDDANIINIIKHASQHSKIIAAICHGPAALVNAKDEQGNWIIANKSISAFTNSEELFLKPNAKSIFPFLLQSQIEKRGALFKGGPDYLNKISIEHGLITGQNPWSTWSLANAMFEQLGYTPVPRALTDEENSVNLLLLLHTENFEAAESYITNNPKITFKTHLLLMHAIVEVMKGNILKSISIIMLTDGARRNNDLQAISPSAQAVNVPENI